MAKSKEAPRVEPMATEAPYAPVDCLYTTVQNTSGADAIFSFLPPHGRTMARQEQLTVAGNLFTRLAGSPRQFRAMERALANGYLTIIQTPSVVVCDNTGASGSTLHPKAIELTGSTLGEVDPCWVSAGPPPAPVSPIEPPLHP